MAYFKLPNEDLPGIVGLLQYNPETARPLRELAEILLRGKSTLTSGEREIIASSVSYWNDCHFCHTSHGAAAAANLNVPLDIIDEIKSGNFQQPISNKIKALLEIARKVQQSGRHVTLNDIQIAKQKSATDLEIHDTVLITAAFCMYNRYVDGLGTWYPENKENYKEMGEKMAKEGYVMS